ncbi:unnamed protein product [Tetraodon nigroviridis]|uniref:(spotted green pufferfish) hypothetical protein n=1 Tax=Tetraodon nigroviridis TaxID=99883 RepID=Q4S5Y4_TETNG|nr:unnamed protein product [Tetraodon nigroviridis]
MSEATDCKQSESAARKRRPSPERDGDGTASKTLKLADGQARVASERCDGNEADSNFGGKAQSEAEGKDLPEAEEGDDSLSGSSSTPSSSFPSDNEDNDDGECAIVSVKMAPEMRQSVALLAQVQMRLEALEKKSARLHQRLELKIPPAAPAASGPAQLLSPRPSQASGRNPYFQNNIIMKELHVGVRGEREPGGPPRSFSNPILWHRGQNLTANSEPRKSSRGVYQTFFNWFSDHGNPRQDDVAQILKDDLYRDPLRYYLTPLWEPRENGR